MQNNNKYSSIISHFDLDGVTSAALCSHIFDIDNLRFCSPIAVSEQPIDKNTIICDLPYPRECGLWFDHHIANKEELAHRNIDVLKIPGELENKLSCLRVIYDFYKGNLNLSHWETLVNEVDTIDAFLFNSPQEWLAVTPINTIDASIKYNHSDKKFLKELAILLKNNNFLDVAKNKEVTQRADKHRNNLDSQLKLIEKASGFLDDNKEIVVIDLTEYHKPPIIQKNMAFTIHTNAVSVIEIRCMYEGTRKTNNLYLSMSLGFTNKDIRKSVDIGKIMRILNIGSGHPGAAAGRIKCKTKAEREKAKLNTLKEINKIWNSQKAIKLKES